MKKQENMTPPKEYNKLSVLVPKKYRYSNCSKKEFKIIVIKMFRELQENTY